MCSSRRAPPSPTVSPFLGPVLLPLHDHHPGDRTKLSRLWPFPNRWAMVKRQLPLGHAGSACRRFSRASPWPLTASGSVCASVKSPASHHEPASLNFSLGSVFLLRVMITTTSCRPAQDQARFSRQITKMTSSHWSPQNRRPQTTCIDSKLSRPLNRPV